MTTVSVNEKKWTDKISKNLVGKKIDEVRYLTAKETKASGWNSRPIMIVLSDGQQLVPMSDDEGNDGGAIGTSLKDMPTIPVMR